MTCSGFCYDLYQIKRLSGLELDCVELPVLREQVLALLVLVTLSVVVRIDRADVVVSQFASYDRG
jgi:hypothetical protein